MRIRLTFAAVVAASLVLAGLLTWIGQGRRGAAPNRTAAVVDSGPRARGVVLEAGAQDSARARPDAAVDGRGPGLDAGVAGPVDASSSLPSYVRIDGRSGTLCPEGMVLVDGLYCPFVAHRCAKRLPGEGGERCQRYFDDLLCEGRPTELHFCIDRFEYPNIAGALPAVMVDYGQAEQACTREGKRLCEADEWTLACEGRDTWPYPYGIERDPSRCRIDHARVRAETRALTRPREASVEVERLDQRGPSGSMPRCVSPFGVGDTTGNVDEWVHHREGQSSGPEFDTASKGGGWGPGPAECRPITVSRGRTFRSPELGFRCCGDARDGRPARSLQPNDVRLPRRRRVYAPG